MGEPDRILSPLQRGQEGAIPAVVLAEPIDALLRLKEVLRKHELDCAEKGKGRFSPGDAWLHNRMRAILGPDL